MSRRIAEHGFDAAAPPIAGQLQLMSSAHRHSHAAQAAISAMNRALLMMREPIACRSAARDDRARRKMPARK
jgi:hypothetical protein